MKRLSVIVLFLSAFLSNFFSGQHSAAYANQKDIDLQDCQIMVIFARVWKYSPLVEKERAVWIVLNSENGYQAIDWLHTPQRRITIWSDTLPEGVVAQAHTHGDRLDPKPSSQDISVARSLKIPIFTLTRKGIWRAMPDGSVIQETGRGWFNKSKEVCGQ